MSDCSAWARAVILSSLLDVSPLNCGIGSSEIHPFKLRMIASWIGGAVFWCDIHLLMGQELFSVSSKSIARDFVYCQL